MTATLTATAAYTIAAAARDYASGPVGLNHGSFFDRCDDLLEAKGFFLPATEQAWDGSDFRSLKAMASRLRRSARSL